MFEKPCARVYCNHCARHTFQGWLSHLCHCSRHRRPCGELIIAPRTRAAAAATDGLPRARASCRRHRQFKTEGLKGPVGLADSRCFARLQSTTLLTLVYFALQPEATGEEGQSGEGAGAPCTQETDVPRQGCQSRTCIASKPLARTNASRAASLCWQYSASARETATEEQQPSPQQSSSPARHSPAMAHRRIGA